MNPFEPAKGYSRSVFLDTQRNGITRNVWCTHLPRICTRDRTNDGVRDSKNDRSKYAYIGDKSTCVLQKLEEKLGDRMDRSHFPNCRVTYHKRQEKGEKIMKVGNNDVRLMPAGALLRN